MTDDLKPCPFCGGTASYEYSDLTQIKFHRVCCNNVLCEVFVIGLQRRSKNAAIAAWNIRVQPPEVTALVEAASMPLEDIDLECSDADADKQRVESLYEYRRAVTVALTPFQKEVKK